jgi:gluconokinase
VERVVVGLDIGTSSIKLALLGKKGVIYSDRLAHSKENSDVKEFDPGTLLADVVRILRKAIRANGDLTIGAVGVGSLFPSLIVLDHQGKPLTKIMTWLDPRGEEIVLDFGRSRKAIPLRERTGCPLDASYPFWKILWLKKNNKKLFDRAGKYLSLPDYLVYKLTGRFLSSTAIASTTGLFNIAALRWDQEILKMAGLAEAQLPEVHSIYHSEKMLKPMRARMGLVAETLVVLGAGDGLLCNIGSGCLGGRRLCSTIGTGAALRIVGDLHKTNSSTWKYHLHDKRYVSGIATNAGLKTLAWFHKNIFQGDRDNLFVDIEKIDLARPTSLLFLPFIDGERGVGPGRGTTASLYGLSSAMTSGDVRQALVEGVLYNLYHCYEAMFDYDSKPKEIVATGGYVYARKMLQMQSDIFNLRVRTPAYKEAGALGAALVARAAIGQSDPRAGSTIKYDEVFLPDRKRHLAHMRKYSEYKVLLKKCAWL